MQSGERGEWARDLLESDRRYFEAGAESISIPGATIAFLRGAEPLAAGCVVHRVDLSGVVDGDAWVVGMEERLRALHCPCARLYLEAPCPRLEEALARRNYRARVEFGFVRAAVRGAGDPFVEVIPADDAPAWSQRRTIMERCGRGPDGHRTDADLWVAMERRKCRAGYMRPYVIAVKGDVVGAVCAARCGSILRLKNLFVDPGCRRRGVATAVAERFAGLAAEAGQPAAGCFAIEGEPGMIVYALAGYETVTRQTEWFRELEGARK
jgi:hypothetical protein